MFKAPKELKKHIYGYVSLLVESRHYYALCSFFSPFPGIGSRNDGIAIA